MRKVLNLKKTIIFLVVPALIAGGIAWWIVKRTNNRVQVEVNVHINREAIYLSVYAEPPQFAIWLENAETGECQTVFVTYRVSRGDWEGKADVPVALPRWHDIFRGGKAIRVKDGDEVAVSGATPKDEYFRIRAEVKPGSEWILWMEMNLAGDYNDFYRQFNRETLQEDEYSCGQPAILYRTELRATEGATYIPEIAAMSLWEDGLNRVLPVDSTITTARDVFDQISVLLVKPKPVIFNKNKVEKQDVLK
ncbi:MAG: hypothetical protein LBH77_00695 [Tannerella sp.]|jgi:hypothetical protein|nr:hypothetical protein [Tannerella sp.]